MDQPSLTTSPAAYWPFYILRKADVLDFIRWEANRRLYAICAVLSEGEWATDSGRPVDSLLHQHDRAAMLSVLLSCLELSLGSGSVVLLSRLAQDRYRRKGSGPTGPLQRSVKDKARIWRQKGSKRKEEEEEDSTEEEEEEEEDSTEDKRRKGATTDRSTGPSDRDRRGLALLDSLRRTNMPWLPEDMFDWDRLRFNTSILAETAFMSADYRKSFRNQVSFTQEDIFRNFVQDQLATLDRPYRPGAGADGVDGVDGADSDSSSLSDPDYSYTPSVLQSFYQLILFRYTNWLLSRLSENDRLPNIASDSVSNDERAGFFGLSYGLIARATGQQPLLSWSRSTGGNLSHTTGGFSDFPNTWATRVQLLFDWDDGFKRSNWDRLPFREWARYCYRQIDQTIGRTEADRWKRGIGRYGHCWLTILPRYEADKMYQFEKAPKNLSQRLQSSRQGDRALKWIAARPVQWRSEMQSSTGKELVASQSWKMLVQEGAYRSKDDLPTILARRPALVNGMRFTLIDSVIGATTAAAAAAARAVGQGDARRGDSL